MHSDKPKKPVKPLPTIHELEDVYDYDFDTESGGTGLLGPNQEVIMSTELAIREAKQADQEAHRSNRQGSRESPGGNSTSQQDRPAS
ncbi:hypothetical protein CDD82_3587 [Ophiocordyceps australis]|uniref:Uncharacterized protein n=1 Tax=Ophiocordyceps australis TaxID=1399860 RepID=A0A2C5ZC12_9HYPO|nr:hypothetical protein CDD82_3587 [Ophiocordyceps australis]